MYYIQPYGRGCFTFDNMCMQHGHYVHVRDPAFDDPTSTAAEVRDCSFLTFLHPYPSELSLGGSSPSSYTLQESLDKCNGNPSLSAIMINAGERRR